MSLPFAKLQGLGNDFVLLDLREVTVDLTPELIRRLGDRRLGIGCDQVLVVAPPTLPDALVDYRIFNATGEEVGHCGNGVRCVARYLARRGECRPGVEVKVNTGGRLIGLMLGDDDRVAVDMGVPDFDPASLPLTRAEREDRYEFELADGRVVVGGAVSMGNPHVVLEVTDTRTARVEELGPELEAHRDFPERVNVGFVQFVDRTHLRLRVFERGVGETPACGTGACAAMAVGRLWGRIDERVTIDLNGGQLDVAWGGENDRLQMCGPAEFVFEGRFEP